MYMRAVQYHEIWFDFVAERVVRVARENVVKAKDAEQCDAR